MSRFIFLVVFALFFHGCSCGVKGGRSEIKIGVDPYWYPLDFGAQNSHVNGFAEELLLDIAHLTGIEFERTEANWDALFDGMMQGRYQAVLSSLSPYEFNTAFYDFSHAFLDLGPVLVVPQSASQTSLEKMSNEHIGVIAGDPAALILQKHQGLVVRSYSSIPDLLEAVTKEEIKGALLTRIDAGRYVNDLFMGKLKIIGPPLNNLGLRLIALKGKQPSLLSQFNQSLAILKKKKRVQALLRKWQLGEMT